MRNMNIGARTHAHTHARTHATACKKYAHTHCEMCFGLVPNAFCSELVSDAYERTHAAHSEHTKRSKQASITLRTDEQHTQLLDVHETAQRIHLADGVW